MLLSLVIALFLFLIVAPRGSGAAAPPARLEPPARRPLAGAVEGALAAAFASISEGRDDVVTILHARALLDRHLRERVASATKERGVSAE